MPLDAKLTEKITSSSEHATIIDRIGIFGARYLIFVMIGSTLLWIWRFAQSNSRLLRTIELSVTVTLAWLVTLALEYLIKRPRPYEVGDSEPLISMWVHTPSFPSAHATIAFAVAGMVFWHQKPAGIILLILAALVAYSRVYVGVHYPTDVLAGALVGFVVSWLVHLVFK
ncbi:phosphatase PAP2 family protein [Patescibacteria group bacterium]